MAIKTAILTIKIDIKHINAYQNNHFYTKSYCKRECQDFIRANACNFGVFFVDITLINIDRCADVGSASYTIC